LCCVIGIGCVGWSAYAGQTDGFVDLFNGRDLTGWVTPADKKPSFEVVDGILETRDKGGGDIFSAGVYANFMLRFEYLLSKTGNSGVLIRCAPSNPWETGVEVQLLAPWKPHRDDLHCTASLYGLVAVSNRPDETTGVWHRMQIRCDRNIIEVSVDGKLATKADINTVKAFDKKLITGAVGFQSNHGKSGEFARFRRIEIRNLDDDPGYVLRGFALTDERFRVQAREAAVKRGAELVGEIADIMNDGSVMERSVARQALLDIAVAASAPDCDVARRTAVIQSLKRASQSECNDITRNYLIWLCGMFE